VVLMQLTAQQPASPGAAERDSAMRALADSTWEMKESRARATSLLEAKATSSSARDKEGRITYANDAYCALADMPARALLGTTAGAEAVAAGPAAPCCPTAPHLPRPSRS